MSGSPLDDPATYARLDPEDLVSRIEALPGQVEDAWEAGQRLELPASYRRVENIAVLGMGGSGIGGSLLQALGVDLGATAPVFTVRSYTLPAYVDERTLVLASSNSGNTEETVAAFERALERGARCIAIATGGRLAQIARERGVPSLLFDWGGEPRAALGWSFIAPLAICSKTGLLPDLAGPLSDAAGELRTLGGEIARHVDEQANPAKRLARRLAGHLPVFVGAGALAPVAYRWRTQVNENANSWAIWDELPEMNHNAQAGYGLPRRVVPLLHAVFLRHQAIHRRVRARIEATTAELASEGVSAEVLDVPGRHLLGQVLWAVHFGDYVSYYLGLLNDVHPSATPALTRIKERMAKQR